MGRPPKEQEDQVTISASELKLIREQMQSQQEEINKLKKNGKGLETTFDRYASKKPEVIKPQPVMIVPEPGEIGTEDRMKFDCCPYCIKFNAGQKTVLDPMNSGKFACRRCGKHWLPEAFEEGLHGKMREYTIDMERGDIARVEEKERVMLARDEKIMVKQ